MGCELIDGLISVPGKQQVDSQDSENLSRHFAHSFMVFGNQDRFRPSPDRSIIHLVYRIHGT